MRQRLQKIPDRIRVAGKWIKIGSEAHPATMPAGYSPEYMKELFRYINVHKPFPLPQDMELHDECRCCGRAKRI